MEELLPQPTCQFLLVQSCLLVVCFWFSAFHALHFRSGCEQDSNMHTHTTYICVYLYPCLPSSPRDPKIVKLPQLLCVQEQQSSGSLQPFWRSYRARFLHPTTGCSRNVPFVQQRHHSGSVEMVAETSTENSTHDRKAAQVSLYFQTVANGVSTRSQFPLSVTVKAAVLGPPWSSLVTRFRHLDVRRPTSDSTVVYPPAMIKVFLIISNNCVSV